MSQQGASAGGDTDSQPAQAAGGDGAVAVAGGGPAAPRVQIGIAMERIPDALAAHLDVEPSEAVLLVNVIEGGAAEKAGLKRYDVITHVDGQSPATQQAIRQAMRAKEPGDAITLRVLRGGEPHEVVITLAEPAQRDVRIQLTPEQMEKWPPHTITVPRENLPNHGNIFITPEMSERQPLGNIYLAPERWREGRQGLERERLRIVMPDQQLRRLREEARRLRELLEDEWNELRETAFDEETLEHLREFADRAAERTATAMDRLAEAMAQMEIRIELDVAPRVDMAAPRVEILPRRGGGRGMVVHPDSEARLHVAEAAERMRLEEKKRRRAVEPQRQLLEDAHRPGPEMDRRLNRLEDRLERIERMIERLVERE